ncbi:MAG: FtsQ-type POTRA domain-containing protein [Deltaproteobacteria bacterium]|nr:FtsQ-type POTRA domain-containing protein [Deltaproteobacteria bacterium]
MTAQRLPTTDRRRGSQLGGFSRAPWRLGRAPERAVTGSHAARERTGERRRTSMLPARLAWGRAVRGAGLLGLAALSALAVVKLASLLENSELLPLKTVTVHGADGPRVDEVLAYAALPLGTPLLSIDATDVAARVAQHPFVARAAVRRVPPDAVVIDVEQRIPMAAVAAGELYLVDRDGNIMKSARAGDGLDLPIITGIPASDIADGGADEVVRGALFRLDAHARAGRPGGALAEIAFVPGVGFELVLEDGLRVRVGDDASETQFLDKLGRLDAVLRRLASAGARASFIHLDDDRRPERAAVRLRTVAETPPSGG